MEPNFQIMADKQDITSRLQDRLLSLRITDESGTQSDTVEIQLDDRDDKISWPVHGATLDISLGFKNEGLVSMGLYIVDEVEHAGPPSTFTLRGKAADMRASIKAPKTRSWDQITLADLVQTIANDHGLTSKVSDTFSGVVLEHVDQTQESDLHLLTRLAREYGAVTKPVAGYLVFVPQGEAKSATGQQLPIINLNHRDVSRHRLSQSERSKYHSVRAFWHDKENAEKQPMIAGEGEPVFEIRHNYSNAQEAIRAAQAKLTQLTRGTSTLSLTLIGNPTIQAEAKIKLTGIRDPIAGEWIVTRVEHQLNNQGFVTRCDAEIPNR